MADNHQDIKLQLEAALDSLPLPDRHLFATLNDEPTSPQDDPAAAETFIHTITTQISLINSLVKSPNAAAALGISSIIHAAHPLLSTDNLNNTNSINKGFQGLSIVELVDEDGSEELEQHNILPEESILVRTVLAIAAYSSLSPASSGGDGDDIASRKQHSNNSIIDKPWVTPAVNQAASTLLDSLATLYIEELHESNQPKIFERQNGNSSNTSLLIQEAQPALTPIEQLLLDTLHPALKRLRPTLTAYYQHMQSQKTRLEPYSGPDGFERLLSAMQLRWFVEELSSSNVLKNQEVVASLLPSCLVCLDDPAPLVQTEGLWALACVGHCTPASVLQPWKEVLPDAACKAVVACDEKVWDAAAHALVTLALKLQGDSPYNPELHTSFTTLLQEGERHAHTPSRTITFLSTAPKLFPAFGLQLVLFFSTLLPLILEWCINFNRDVRFAALEALEGAVKYTWPRMPVHAGIVWSVLDRVYLDETVFRTHARGDDDYNEDGRNANKVLIKVQEVARLVWKCGGTEFRNKVIEEDGKKERKSDRPSSLVGLMLT